MAASRERIIVLSRREEILCLLREEWREEPRAEDAKGRKDWQEFKEFKEFKELKEFKGGAPGVRNWDPGCMRANSNTGAFSIP
ncbi:MAG: hypothetical protein JOZ31_13930 [Verrucomicrobia bacterium]|nr:hypothetical protein [Verrucomicrobiota bacterium]MBV8482854.1 hypothetical protein [Verrucomicrobiota bacterium]